MTGRVGSVESIPKSVYQAAPSALTTTQMKPRTQNLEPRTSNLRKRPTAMSLTLTLSPISTSTDTAALPASFAPTLTPSSDPAERANSADDDAGNDEAALSSYARCADGNGTLSFLFFSEDDLELARAKAICRACGLQEACLSGAIERQEPYGIWGGKLVLDGVPVEFKRKRGRPRKNPAPVLVVDEAPIPPHLVA